MTTTKTLVTIACFAMTMWTLPVQEARACGGCVAPPGTFSAVDSHRMVIKLGLQESILWDQFIYSGSPEEFAWVLPVPGPDTVVELADAEFIDTLDNETSARVLAPDCAGAASGGCGGWGGDFSGATLADSVEVHSREIVGPYETVVIGAEDPNALYAWLGQNGYAFPDSGFDILKYYTDKGSSFVVLRLRPGLEVTAMQPVRVRFRGFMSEFPLKMISLGASGSVDLSLWIVADERYAPTNFESETIDPAVLRWDWSSNTSNYPEVFAAAVQGANGSVWITEYAKELEGSELEEKLAEQSPVDLAMAREGIHYPVVTRLRTRLPVEELAEDLLLAPSAEPGEVSRDLIAEQSLSDCPSAVAAGDASGAGAREAQGLFWLFLVIAGLWFRRRSRRRA